MGPGGPAFGLALLWGAICGGGRDCGGLCGPYNPCIPIRGRMIAFGTGGLSGMNGLAATAGGMTGMRRVDGTGLAATAEGMIGMRRVDGTTVAGAACGQAGMRSGCLRLWGLATWGLACASAAAWAANVASAASACIANGV